MKLRRESASIKVQLNQREVHMGQCDSYNAGFKES